MVLLNFRHLALLLAALPYHIHAQDDTTLPTVKIKLDTTTRHQIITGFGISQAFQRARQIASLSPSTQQQVLDLLFSRDTGAGLTLLRNGIGSSPSYDRDWMKSIEPISPGSANATPKYEWDGDDAGQVWLTKEAVMRGADVYADAWSAPGFMKSNGKDSDGGYFCGVRGTNCLSGDWRRRYAEYLVQYLRFYRVKEGIDIRYLGFLNEPDLNQTYASMQASGFQVADFLPVLRATLAASEFRDVQIVCCEATGWSDAEDLLAELQSVPGAEGAMDVYSAHGYSTHPALPFNTTKPVWQTEWADLNGRWTTAWDDLGKEGEGIAWANKIQSALILSNVSTFFYWIGAEEGPNNSALIRIQNGTISVSARMWAFAQFSRFVRPGAIRLGATSDTGYVTVSAFIDVVGDIVLGVINNGHTDVRVEVEVVGVDDRATAMPWVTNNQNNLTRLESIQTLTGGNDGNLGFKATIMKRSMVSFML